MIHRQLLLCAALAAAIPLAAQAAPTSYTGTLTPGVFETGSAGGFSSLLNEGAGVQFWSFSGTAGTTVTLEVDRLNANFDPVLSLYSGMTTASNASFDSSASWGGMTYVGGLDDEHPPFMTPGPDGDPYGSFTLATTGEYTVAIGGGLSTDAGDYPYQVELTQGSAAAVPEPASWALLFAGLGMLGLVRRRRR